jgi:vitamin B12 transporter
LAPEESIGWDIGLEQSFFDGKLIMGATYFQNDFKEMIEFNSATWTYNNVAKANTSGIELFASAQPIDNLSIYACYTYTSTEDETTGEELLRRPKDKFDLNLNYRFVENGNVNLGVVYVGKRFDYDYSLYERVEMDGYVLVNMSASYKIFKIVQIFGRIENLLDEEYEQVIGYGTPGISAFAGLKFLF